MILVGNDHANYWWILANLLVPAPCPPPSLLTTLFTSEQCLFRGRVSSSISRPSYFVEEYLFQIVICRNVNNCRKSRKIYTSSLLLQYQFILSCLVWIVKNVGCLVISGFNVQHYVVKSYITIPLLSLCMICNYNSYNNY